MLTERIDCKCCQITIGCPIWILDNHYLFGELFDIEPRTEGRGEENKKKDFNNSSKNTSAHHNQTMYKFLDINTKLSLENALVTHHYTIVAAQFFYILNILWFFIFKNFQYYWYFEVPYLPLFLLSSSLYNVGSCINGHITI